MTSYPNNTNSKKNIKRSLIFVIVLLCAIEFIFTPKANAADSCKASKLDKNSIAYTTIIDALSCLVQAPTCAIVSLRNNYDKCPSITNTQLEEVDVCNRGDFYIGGFAHLWMTYVGSVQENLCNTCQEPNEQNISKLQKSIILMTQQEKLDAEQQQNFENTPIIGWAYKLGAGIWGALGTIWEIINGHYDVALRGIAKFFQGVISDFSKILYWAINPQTYGGFSTNQGVRQVWGFMKDLANIGLILGMVFIAIATILRASKYNAKAILWKLLVIALLVNFSLVITGMLVDIFNFFSVYFLNLAINPNQIAISNSIEGGYGYVTVVNSLAGTNNISNAWTNVNDFGQFLIIAAVLIITGLLTLIAILIGFVSLIVRAFVIFMCLAVSPLAFISWIFPITKNFWKTWSSQLLKWLSFGVIFTFVLYIGLSVVSHVNLPSDAGIVEGIITCFMFSSFLIGGLLVALQGGTDVSKSLLKYSAQLVDKGRKSLYGAFQKSRPYEYAGRTLTKVPGLKTVGFKMMTARPRAIAKKQVDIQKDIESLTNQQFKDIAKNIRSYPQPIQIAILNRAIKEDALDNRMIEIIARNSKNPTFIQSLDINNLTKQRPDLFKYNSETKKLELIPDDLKKVTQANIKKSAEALAQAKDSVLREQTNKKAVLLHGDYTERGAREWLQQINIPSTGSIEKDIAKAKLEHCIRFLQAFILASPGSRTFNAFIDNIPGSLFEEWAVLGTGLNNARELTLEAARRSDDVKQRLNSWLPYNRELQGRLNTVLIP